jgi:hypothetical protein
MNSPLGGSLFAKVKVVKKDEIMQELRISLDNHNDVARQLNQKILNFEKINNKLSCNIDDNF